MNSDLATKGQILVGDGSGDPTALSVGSNNYVLTADGNEATGVKWAAVSGGGGLSNVVEDTSPQLGGNLDVQANEITTSTTNGNIVLNPNGEHGVVRIKGDSTNSVDGTLELRCSSNSHGVKIKSPPHSAAQTYTLTLPSSIVDNGFLKTDSNGGLSFATQTDATKMPLTGGTFTGSVTFEDAINEKVFPIPDGNAAIDPDNGTIQTWTLGDNRTPTDSLTAGQSVLLMITAGSYQITWPTITWAGGSQPTLSTSAKTAIELWKVGSNLYGANVGDL